MRAKLLNMAKYVCLMALIIGLFAFSNVRNSTRNIESVNVQFVGNNTALITKSMVNKLLIQNEDSLIRVGKEILDLNEMEALLDNHPMISKAEVYLTVDGNLGATVLQRKPIARVATTPSYYIDSNGQRMPLSKIHTVRVPLVSGVDKDNLYLVKDLLTRLDNDGFMSKHIVGVHVNKNQTVELLMRKHDLKIYFGKPENIDRKFRNFKAFYQNTIKDNSLSKYSKINLTVNTQVVATKK